MPDRLITLLVFTEVTGEVKIMEKDILPKKLLMILARKIAVMMLCWPKVSRSLTRESVELSAIFEEVKTWAEAGVSIIRIPIVEEEVSMTTISIAGLTTKK